MLTASDALLLKQIGDRIGMGDWTGDHLEDSEIDPMLAHLRRIAGVFEEKLVPATRGQILTVLADFADMLQVRAPSDSGIELYVVAMEDMPAVLLDRAVRHVARTHRYARLPLPSDFINGVQGEIAYCRGKKTWPGSLITRLDNVLRRRRNQGRKLL